MGDPRALRRRWFVRRLPWALLSCVATMVQAVRVTDVPLYATLACAVAARSNAGECMAPEGSHVELVAEVAGPGVVPASERRWFVHVINGPCTGAEASVPERCLRDQRAVPQPSPPAGRPR
jgi:hypothetical protein